MYFLLSCSIAIDASETATGIPARDMLEQCGLLPVPPANAVILDNACGAAIVTARLFESIGSDRRDLTVVCGDLDQTMVELSEQRIKANGWNAQVKRIDAQAMPYGAEEFTHAMMNFGPQLMSDPMLALRETHRVLRKGGYTGFTCWTKPGWIPSVMEAFPSFSPPSLLSSPWKDPDSIKANLSSLGFTDIIVSTLDFKTREENLEAYLELMKLLLAKLLVGENAAIYESHMRAKYARGEIEMSWQALVVSAVKP
jgi:ubiquinone/menaquinone biosynthesis C-methylase UbiE